MRKLALALILLAACRTEYKKEVATTNSPKPVPVVQAQEVSGVEVGNLHGYAMMSKVAGGQPGGIMADAAYNTEEYGRFEENPFLRPGDNPLSTFSIDVDRASYANVRRILREGNRPPRQAVRIEEMINYFTYDYPEPGVGAPVSIT